MTMYIETYYIFTLENIYGGELIIDQLVWSLVVEPTHPGSSPQLGTGARTFLNLFQNFPALCVKW